MNLQEQMKVREQILRLQLQVSTLMERYAQLKKDFERIGESISEVQARKPGRPRKND